MKDEKISDQLFWRLVSELGYPTSPRGLIYGSSEHKTYSDIKWMWSIAKSLHNGERIGWVAGMSYSRDTERYQSVYLVAQYVLGGWDNLRSTFINKINTHYKIEKDCIKICESRLRDLRKWIKEGGIVTLDSCKDICKSLKMCGKYFGNEEWHIYIKVFHLLEIPTDKIRELKKEFVSRRDALIALKKKLLKLAKEIYEEAGIDSEICSL